MKYILAALLILAPLSYGTVSQIATFSKIYAYDQQPTSKLIPVPGQSNDYYGFTGYYSGANSQGSLYELKLVSGSWQMQTIYSFTTTTGKAKIPRGDFFVDVSGGSTYVYGTSEVGGTNGYGSIFKLTITGGSVTETILYSFGNQDSAFPVGLVRSDSGTFYGLVNDVNLQAVTLWKYAGSTFTVLHTWEDEGSVQDQVPAFANGYLYGTITGDFENTFGIVWKYQLSNGTTTELHRFYEPDTAFSYPYTGLGVDGNGVMWGVAYWGRPEGYGSREGGIFSITSGGTYTEYPYSTGGVDSYYPVATPLLADGNFYGTNSGGSTYGCGGFWKFDTSGHTYTHVPLTTSTCSPEANLYYDGTIFLGLVSGWNGTTQYSPAVFKVTQ